VRSETRSILVAAMLAVYGTVDVRLAARCGCGRWRPSARPHIVPVLSWVVRCPVLPWEVGSLVGMNAAKFRPLSGAFPNGMTSARLGDGPKTLVWLASGTKGLMLALMTRVVRPFVADGYAVTLVSGRPNMPTGHTIGDMADDYAALIAEEFDGRVDLVIGHSTGGMIGLCLAARHPDRFGHIVLAGAGLWGERSDRANLESARLLVAGRTREAGEQMVRLLLPNLRLPGAAPLLGVLIARASLAQYEAEDLLVSAEAMHAFDPQEVLPSIEVPVLLVVGEKDLWFSPEAAEQAAQLIARCALRLYPTTNHFGAITSPRFPADVRDFIRHDQQAPA
jgi:pimeloyl-ACP methyl ester carboxylesterase